MWCLKIIFLLLLDPARTTVLSDVMVIYQSDGTNGRPLPFGARQVVKTLRAAGFFATSKEVCSDNPISYFSLAGKAHVLLCAGKTAAAAVGFNDMTALKRLGEEGFFLKRLGTSSVAIVASTGAGVMYGALELTEQVRTATRIGTKNWITLLSSLREKNVTARFAYRALKINLPWSPYRNTYETSLHWDTCRDPAFWEAFLDMMAINRFNTLTMWSMHPWPYMIRPTNFPNATSMSDEELSKWESLHTSIFRMARERAIAPFIVDWNIFVSTGYKTAYDPTAHSDADGPKGDATITTKSKRYNKECITQAIDMYPDMAGIGITLGDRVDNLNLTGQVSWVQDVVIAGILAASRPSQLIYRAAPGEGPGKDNDPKVVRTSIEKSKLPAGSTWVQLKFNWSHGHSTPLLVKVHGGGKGEAYYVPPPTSYRITWMVRNEDFFFLRWGEPNFIRNHIARNGQSYVDGYAVGSEGYIPAHEYAELPATQTWQYMFERQWFFYMLWGRLLYEPSTSDSVFEAAFDNRYNTTGWGKHLLAAIQAGSRMPLAFARFVDSTWDYTLYSAGFLQPFGNPDKFARGFLSVEALLKTKVLDPSLQSIHDFLLKPNKTLTSPVTLASELLMDGATALAVPNVSAGLPPQLELEVCDIHTWGHLSLYFGYKILGTVALGRFRSSKVASDQADAIANFTVAEQEWSEVARLTVSHLRHTIPLSSLHFQKIEVFSWNNYTDMVKRDLAIARKG